MLNSKELQHGLRQSSLDMLSLCKKQLVKARICLVNFDTELAEEVIYAENRVNALDFKIEADCEKYLALYTPVASDLRLVLMVRKIHMLLERVC